MYFVDQKKIEEILIYMDELLEIVSTTSFQSNIEMIALERITHVLIESSLDVGNMMIDGFIMRDPGSYEDIIDILLDEKVLPQEQEVTYKKFISLRKVLVTDYLNVDHDKLLNELTACVSTLKSFSTHIRTYLTNELGVANTFLNQEG